MFAKSSKLEDVLIVDDKEAVVKKSSSTVAVVSAIFYTFVICGVTMAMPSITLVLDPAEEVTSTS